MALGQHPSWLLDGLDNHWNDAEGASAFLPGLAGPGGSRGSCSSPWYARGFGGIGNKSSDRASGFSRHLIRPPKVWLVLDFLQHSMYWFLEYDIGSLCVGCSRLPYEVSPQAIAVIPVRPEIPPLLKDNLLFSSSLQLVFLHPLKLVDPIHQLAHTGDGLASQRLSQAVIGWETIFKSDNGDVVKIVFHFIVCLLISV